jgi:hypothetical protein
MGYRKPDATDAIAAGQKAVPQLTTLRRVLFSRRRLAGYKLPTLYLLARTTSLQWDCAPPTVINSSLAHIMRLPTSYPYHRIALSSCYLAVLMPAFMAQLVIFVLAYLWQSGSRIFHGWLNCSIEERNTYHRIFPSIAPAFQILLHYNYICCIFINDTPL